MSVLNCHFLLASTLLEDKLIDIERVSAKLLPILDTDGELLMVRETQVEQVGRTCTIDNIADACSRVSQYIAESTANFVPPLKKAIRQFISDPNQGIDIDSIFQNLNIPSKGVEKNQRAVINAITNQLLTQNSVTTRQTIEGPSRKPLSVYTPNYAMLAKILSNKKIFISF